MEAEAREGWGEGDGSFAGGGWGGGGESDEETGEEKKREVDGKGKRSGINKSRRESGWKSIAGGGPPPGVAFSLKRPTLTLNPQIMFPSCHCVCVVLTCASPGSCSLFA